jgi:hypothetical protein
MKGIILCVAVLFLFALVSASDSSLDKCALCQKGCDFLSNENTQKKCLQFCSISVCSGLFFSDSETAVESKSTTSVEQEVKEEAASIDKCKLCHAGCSFFKKEEDTKKCGAVCDALLCSSSSSQVTPFSETDSELNIDKCKLCKAGCSFIKNQDTEKKCEALCDALLCSSSSDSQVSSDSEIDNGAAVCVPSGINLRNGPCGDIVRSTSSQVSATVVSSQSQFCDNLGNTFTWLQLTLSTGETVYAAQEAGVSAGCGVAPTPSTSSGSAPTPATSTGSDLATKANEALTEIFQSEGLCQNWASDSGNHFNGEIGYTCMGLIPEECWDNRNAFFQYAASSYSGSPAQFCKFAYDMDKTQYKSGAAQLYIKKYFTPGGCSVLPQPAFYVCSDIAVLSGIGRSQRYLKQLGPLTATDAASIKDYAHKLNNLQLALPIVFLNLDQRMLNSDKDGLTELLIVVLILILIQSK